MTQAVEDGATVPIYYENRTARLKLNDSLLKDIDKPMKGHNLMQAIARVNRVYKDKEAGLIVDYIGMGAELKSALKQYTKRDQDKVPDLGQAFSIAIAKLEVMRDMFYGFDYSLFFGNDNNMRLNVIKDGVMKKYNNRLITSAEVIEELLNLSKEMKEAFNAGNEKGLSQEELAFYDALVEDPEVLRNMEDKVLVEMAHELTDLIRRSRTVDWDKKQSARAYMRKQVKHLLRKYKYPPEKARGAIDTVIKQAELMSSNIVV